MPDNHPQDGPIKIPGTPKPVASRRRRPARADADLVVLGAGPAGLGAAWLAARSGRRVVVLERGAAVGGAAGSFEVAGLRVDYGSHRLHPSIDPIVLDELRRLLGTDLQERVRRGRIRLEGRWIAFPLRTTDLVRRLPPSFAAKAARDAALGWARRAREDSFADVVRANLGPTMADRFYLPYARKLWGLDPRELSAEQARRRVGAASPAAILRRLVPGGSEERRTFFYPRRGYGQISERLAEAAAGAGADIRLRSNVEGLEPSDAGMGVVVGGRKAIHAPMCFSTIPITSLSSLVRPSAPAAVLAAASSLEFRAMVLVYLVLEVRRYTPFDAHYVPGPETPISRLSEPRNYRDGDDPPGRTVICAELPCRAGGYLWRSSDQALAAVVAEGLAELGLPPVRPAAVEVRRLERAYPLYRAGYEAALGALDAWVETVPRLVTFGRQGLFAHDNTHHALVMAWEASAALGPGGEFDQAAWAAARERFKAHVVED
jgi:protoporphyrinogen oxidase